VNSNENFILKIYSQSNQRDLWRRDIKAGNAGIQLYQKITHDNFFANLKMFAIPAFLMF
jgi:hypothetical protein